MSDDTLKVRKRIANTLLNVKHHNHAEIKFTADYKRIEINFDRMYMSDFELEWCDTMKHYRVYILIAYTGKVKERAGFPICVLKDGNSACEFVTMYNFLVHNRANQRQKD